MKLIIKCVKSVNVKSEYRVKQGMQLFGDVGGS